VSATHRIGADENGLGARLGPLVVTAVLARVSGSGEDLFAKKLPKAVAAMIGDSKARMSHSDVSLGEAWARALCPGAETPDAVFTALSLDGAEALRAPCPGHVCAQCWSAKSEAFTAEPELVEQARATTRKLEARGLELLSVKSAVRCTHVLNRDLGAGKNRFVTDLHAMEQLVLSHRERAGSEVLAICGKVGGIADYSRFFGPLSQSLHVTLERGRALSAYRFPGLGEVRFVRDADARDPLVMLASLVGKWVRELMMARVARWYADAGGGAAYPSGYHDPVTARFVEATRVARRTRDVPDDCFERAKAGDE
jgi:ribonuclease HII